MPGTSPGAVYGVAPWLSSRSIRQLAIATASPNAIQKKAEMKSARGETSISVPLDSVVSVSALMCDSLQ